VTQVDLAQATASVARLRLPNVRVRLVTRDGESMHALIEHLEATASGSLTDAGPAISGFVAIRAIALEMRCAAAPAGEGGPNDEAGEEELGGDGGDGGGGTRRTRRVAKLLSIEPCAGLSDRCVALHLDVRADERAAQQQRAAQQATRRARSSRAHWRCARVPRYEVYRRWG
jgi:hypothetical protein